jgi:rfaE bifunctional protein nucleotidyltransferase chain/domain/rfaE bifunctional protein kinase chain/domain
MTAPHVVVIGDAMLDRTIDGTSDRLCPDAPVPVLDVQALRETPGGAGLAALMAAESRCRVTLVAPIADDAAGRRLTGLLAGRVHVLPCGHQGPTRTKTRIRSGGQWLARLDEGGPGEPTTVPIAAIDTVLETADAVLVSDYGAGITRHAHVRSALSAAARRSPVVWDPHPRGAPPAPGTSLATPNLSEARTALAGTPGEAIARTASPEVIADLLARRWPVRAVSVTAGAAGAFLAIAGDDVRYLPAVPAPGGDPCGAGDRFAASATVALAHRELLSEAVARGVADASDWVATAGRCGVAVPPTPAGGPSARPLDAAREHDVADLARQLRAGGRTLVATGGCFDIVHAGHIATLQAARRLGDALVVLVNSDSSVRRLKGPDRPLVAQNDRARVLQAFDCVDAVLVFDEDDPRRALAALRPDVWVKGGDYGGTDLPEGDLVASYGGSTVLVPYLSGRSTTTIIERTRTSNPTDDLESSR